MAKKLLLVDDEEFFLEGLKEGLEKHKNIFTTDICFSVDDAVKRIKKRKYDLIVSDMRMPNKSGLDLFIYLSKKKYKGGFIVMTAYGTDELLVKVRKMGGIEVLLKPFKLDWFSKHILAYFSEELETFERLDSIDLRSLIEIVNLEKKSVGISVEIGDKKGCLYFKAGEIINAEFDDKGGEDAAIYILRNGKEKFSIQKKSKDMEEIISKSIFKLFQISQREDSSEVSEKINQKKFKKEINMDINKLNESIEILKKDLGDGLLATDIFDSKDGQSIAAFNSQPAASALFNKMTNFMKDALEGAGFPGLGKYYILDLVDDKMVIVTVMGDFQWGMLIDRSKTQMGLMLNVILPKAIDSFEEAITG